MYQVLLERAAERDLRRLSATVHERVIVAIHGWACSDDLKAMDHPPLERTAAVVYLSCASVARAPQWALNGITSCPSNRSTMLHAPSPVESATARHNRIYTAMLIALALFCALGMVSIFSVTRRPAMQADSVGVPDDPLDLRGADCRHGGFDEAWSARAGQ